MLVQFCLQCQDFIPLQEDLYDETAQIPVEHINDIIDQAEPIVENGVAAFPGGTWNAVSVDADEELEQEEDLVVGENVSSSEVASTSSGSVALEQKIQALQSYMNNRFDELARSMSEIDRKLEQILSSAKPDRKKWLSSYGEHRSS